MAATTCSVHPLDVRLLKVYVSTIQGGEIPDLRQEAHLRRQRDILINWSRRVARAAAPLQEMVPREDWTLYTRMRPFFITADTPEQVMHMIERLFAARSLEDVVNFFREEVARIDPERADVIIDAAQQDKTPGLIDYIPQDTIEDHLRAYLMYERHQLQDLLQQGEAAGEDTLARAGHFIAWRASLLLANIYPWWVLPGASLTAIAQRGDLGMGDIVADPRGIFGGVLKQLPALAGYIPYALTDSSRTGMCVPPRQVATLLAQMEGWPTPILPHPTHGVVTPSAVRALREAAMYAKHHNAGLWEVAGLVGDAAIPLILDEQGDREEHPEKYAPLPVPVAVGAATEEAPAQSGMNADSELAKSLYYAQKIEETLPAGDELADGPLEAPEKKPNFLNKLFGKKK